MTVADDLQRLNEMRRTGALSEAEYRAAKLKILDEPSDYEDDYYYESRGLTTAEVNNWGMLIHFTQFCGYLVPLAGMVVPIVLWQMKKNDSPIIDHHGRVVANWIISEIIYAFVSVLLVFLIIGVPLLIGLGIVGIVFPIIGGVKAGSGEVWEYPLSIQFLG